MSTAPRASRSFTCFDMIGSSVDSSLGSRVFTSQNLWLSERSSTENSSSPTRARPAPNPVMLLSIAGLLGAFRHQVKPPARFRSGKVRAPCPGTSGSSCGPSSRWRSWPPSFSGGPAADSLLARRCPSPRKILLVRPDNRVGEALLTTPLLRTLKALPGPAPQVHVLVHAKVARALAGHPDADAVIAFDRRRLWLGPFAPGIRALRREHYDTVVDCANWDAPSVTSALDLPTRGPSCRGHRTSGVARVPAPIRLRERPPGYAPGGHSARPSARAPLVRGPIADTLSFREPNISDSFRAYLKQEAQRPCAVVNPGGRLGWRRIPPEAFAAAARALLASGRVPIVTWGPGEEALAQSVVQGAPGARLAPPTNLDELAALMRDRWTDRDQQHRPHAPVGGRRCTDAGALLPHRHGAMGTPLSSPPHGGPHPAGRGRRRVWRSESSRRFARSPRASLPQFQRRSGRELSRTRSGTPSWMG